MVHAHGHCGGSRRLRGGTEAHVAESGDELFSEVPEEEEVFGAARS
jgi:hypothetical protein